MPIRKYKPVTPGRRQMTVLTFDEITTDTPHAPFDLHHDLARHLWDESRHSQFGFRQLPKLGVDLMTLEHSLDLYNILIQMPPHETPSRTTSGLRGSTRIE